MFHKKNEFFKDIKKNSKICIWGGANAGISTKEELLQVRPDVKVVAFIDSSKTGNIDGIKIYKPEDFPNIKDNIDYMLITTRSDCTVIDAFLFYYGFSNKFKRISPYLLKKYQFIPSKVSKVLEILDSNKDKKLYKDLIEARITNDTKKIKKYVLKEHNITSDRKRTIKHYTSYINYDAIETVLEGGMFNGLNTIIFKKLFKNLKKVYAFELIYDKVKNKSISHIISEMQNSKELEIIPLALWDKKEKLTFTENLSAPYSSGINPPLNRNSSEQEFLVNAISIDEYVKENNVPKIDFIKMDIEGAETQALIGAKETLIQFRPQLAISIYHSNNDLQDIPIYLSNILKDYVFKIGQYSPDNDETILYAIPKELYKNKE